MSFATPLSNNSTLLFFKKLFYRKQHIMTFCNNSAKQNTVLCKSNATKCANFVLCSHALSRKVHAKLRVTIQGLLSEISLEQRTIFRQTFVAKRNFTMRSFVSLIHYPKFCVGQTQQLLTRSIQCTRHITFAKDIQKVFNAPPN